MKTTFSKLSDADIRQRLEALVEAADGAIRVDAPPESAASLPGARQGKDRLGPARSLVRPLPVSRRVTSFTALSRDLSGAEQLPDHDAGTGRVSARLVQESESVPLTGIFAFPRGARAGSCLHAIFERLDFTQNDRATLEALVTETLVLYGFSVDWGSVVADMVERVLTTPLDAAGLHLGAVAPTSCLVEMEFHYPLASIRAAGLRRLLQANGLDASPSLAMALKRLTFADIEGYMKGFIDLVFEADGRYYLVDYKSNWLGPRLSDYGRKQLAETIARDAYFLQYLLYSVALHRYLGRRLTGYEYERHFGGVFYLFLRGMDPESGPNAGVFADRPCQVLINALDDYLANGEDAA